MTTDDQSTERREVIAVTFGYSWQNFRRVWILGFVLSLAVVCASVGLVLVNVQIHSLGQRIQALEEAKK